jgi:hypothetical protein
MFAIANLAAHRATVQDPWTFHSRVPPALRADKNAFVEWCQQPNTSHCHFSGYEGQDANLRLSKSNPAFRIHAFVADYDTNTVTTEQITALRAKSPGEVTPNYGSLTFSGGGRLVWLLDEPVLAPPAEMMKDFLKLVAKRLRLAKFFPGFDYESAFLHVIKYYEAGTAWSQLATDKLSARLVCQWIYEAGNDFAWKRLAATAIPLEEVSKEIQARYPGRWEGVFELGARGCRFWDPLAKNPTSAIVRETGMQCFSGANSFMPWASIFGQNFVDRHQAEQTGEAIKDIYYDGRDYWRKLEEGYWRSYSKEDIKLLLKVKHGLSSSVGKKENCSDLDRALHTVHEHKHVEAALPFVHFPTGLIWQRGHRFLNISTTTVTEPCAAPVAEWGQGFPWLATFLDGFFASRDQLPHFLAWLRHFYGGAYRQQPQQGQAIFIAGDAGRGKSLLSTGILSTLMGGHADASEYFLRETRFTSQILSAPIMVVDDTSPAADQTSHNKYSAMIKKITANMFHNYEKKFQSAAQLEWVGRVVVTCNMDPDSIRLLPNVEISVLDKISLFRCASRDLVFPPAAEIRRILAEELPCFASWLLHSETDALLRGANRFGVRPYHDNVLYSSALQSGASYSFLELLRAFLERYADSPAEDGSLRTHWSGTPTDLLRDMTLTESIRDLARQYKPAQVATLLGQLKSRGYNFDRGRTADRRWWAIPITVEDPQQGDMP